MWGLKSRNGTRKERIKNRGMMYLHVGGIDLLKTKGVLKTLRLFETAGNMLWFSHLFRERRVDHIESIG